jgi:hypothetical protein
MIKHTPLQWHVRRSYYPNHAPYVVLTSLREFRNLITIFNLVVRELPREHRVVGVLRRHVVVPSWGVEVKVDQSFRRQGELIFLFYSQVQVEHLQHWSPPALDDGSGEAIASTAAASGCR